MRTSDHLNSPQLSVGQRRQIEELRARLGAREDLKVPHPKECLYVIPSTICNLKCRFCAYSISSIPKQVMPFEFFCNVIDRACDFGFSSFGLTPIVGEVFTDPGWFEKLSFLEQHAGARSYSFCTNLTLASPDMLRALTELRKLKWLSISLYGHDERTFSSITKSAPHHFRKMIENLELLSTWPGLSEHTELRIRTSADFCLSRCDPQLRKVIESYRQQNVRIRLPHDKYSNWGGLISADDVIELGIELKKLIPKPAIPCAFLFYKHTVLPDGRLNACYAEDGNATMVIGNLSKQSFEEIYSLENEAYLGLILQHATSRLNPVCQACSGYRGIDQQHYTYRFHERPFLTIDDFLKELTPPATQRPQG